MSNAFRIQPEKSRRLNAGVIFIGYVLSVFAVPIAAAGISLIMVPYFAPDRPELLENVRNYVIYSGLIAWCISPLAVVAAWYMSKHGYIGWATALLAGFAGTVPAAPTFWFMLGDRIGGDFISFLWVNVPLGTCYGISVWIMLRLLRPDVFSTDKAPETTAP